MSAARSFSVAERSRSSKVGRSLTTSICRFVPRCLLDTPEATPGQGGHASRRRRFRPPVSPVSTRQQQSISRLLTSPIWTLHFTQPITLSCGQPRAPMVTANISLRGVLAHSSATRAKSQCRAVSFQSQHRFPTSHWPNQAVRRRSVPVARSATRWA